MVNYSGNMEKHNTCSTVVTPVTHIATEMTVPVVTNYSSTPIMTIILQVLRDQEMPKVEEKEDEDKRESFRNEMTSAWRVISFFFVVFVLPTILISVPLYARYHIYHAKNHFLTDGDMQSFHNDVSSFWCQGQRLISNGSFEAYLTKETRRTKTKRISNLSSNLLLMHDEIEEWGVHLIKGSQFKFSACSRWAGGTLLVVQGEENMRRCFYKEERVHEELKEDETKKNIKMTQDHKLIVNYDDVLMGEGEVLDNYEELSQHEIIRKLYSSTRSNANQGSTTETYDTTMSSTQTSSSPNNGTDSSIEAHVSKQDFVKVSKKVKSAKERKKKKRKNKKINKKAGIATTNSTNDKDIKTEEISHVVKRAVNPTNMESIKVDKGSVFFNMNDTLDITSGNSSFSSSEEFLRQCSNTIISIDLTPYPDCTQRTSSMNDSTMTWKFRANTTDYYYFIFTSDNSLEANVISFNVLLERRLYNVSDYLEKCTNSSECVFPFSFMKSEGVIVDFSEHFENISNLDDLHNYEITAICQPRTVVYTVFILCVPFIIILFAFR